MGSSLGVVTFVLGEFRDDVVFGFSLRTSGPRAGASVAELDADQIASSELLASCLPGRQSGFAGVDAGALAESRRQQPGSPLHVAFAESRRRETTLTPPRLRELLAAT